MLLMPEAARMAHRGMAVARMAMVRNLPEDPRVLSTFTAGLEESRGAPQGQATPSGLY